MVLPGACTCCIKTLQHNEFSAKRQTTEEADFLKIIFFNFHFLFAAAQNAEAHPSVTKIETKV